MYHEMIGSLMFLTDLIYVHLMLSKHAVRYLNGTVEYGLKYEMNQKINLEGYVDTYWVVPLIRIELHCVVLVWD